MPPNARQSRFAEGERYNGNLYNAMFGADMVLGEDWVAGVAVGHDRNDISLISASGSLEGSGISGTAYVAHSFNKYLLANVMASYGAGENEISESRLGQRATGKFDGQRYMLAADLQATATEGPFEVTGTLGFHYGHQWFDPYTASSGLRVMPGNVRLGQLHSEVEVSYALADWIVPFATVGHDLDFVSNRVSSNESIKDNRYGVTTGGGVRVQIGDQLTAIVSGNKEFLRRWEDTFSVNVSLRYRF